MKPRTIKFHDVDWETLSDLAQQKGLSVGALVNEACRRLVSDEGQNWRGTSAWGGDRKSEESSIERAYWRWYFEQEHDYDITHDQDGGYSFEWWLEHVHKKEV